MKTPYIDFFIVKHDKKEIPYENIYDKCLAETIQYYNDWGKDGFLSERIKKEDIPKIAEKGAKLEYATNQQCSGSIESIVIDPTKEEEIRKSVESRDDFVKWIDKNTKLKAEMIELSV